MSNNNVSIENNIEIDKGKADELLRWLILSETRNAKTKEKSDQQMVTAIQKKIEEVVQCY
jgi:hypothetical protein